MSVTGVLDHAEALGVELWIDGEMLRYRGPREAVAKVRPELAHHKQDIISILRERSGTTATDAVLAAQQLLRDGQFAPEAPPCAFHIGNPHEGCRRCKAPIVDHYRLR